MLNLACGKNMFKLALSFVLAASILLLTACGGGGGPASGAVASGVPATTAASGAAIAAPVVVPTLTLSIVNAAGAAVNTISATVPVTVKAVLLDAKGVVVPNTVVTFSTNAALATMNPVGGTALTDATGTASIQITSANISAAGAATITATAQVAAAAVTGTSGFAVGATSVTMTNPVMSVTSPLAAFSTAKVSVNVSVSSGGVAVTTPQVVSFTSTCASSGKATLSPTATTVGGVATAVYVDNGCAGSDTITASVGGGFANSSSLITVTAPASPSLVLTLANASGVAVSTISTAAPVTVKAVVLSAAGVAVPNTVVTFTTNAALVSMNPVAGTALTDVTGTASIQISPVNNAIGGATTISASASVGATAVSASSGFSIGASVLTLSAPTFGATLPLSAFGTTSVSVIVSSGGVAVSTPQTVNFASTCASAGKAVLSTGVTTVNGVAIASYRDNGCASTDIITATVGLVNTTANIAVNAPAVGSIQFVSATPTNISLKGSGGSPTAAVIFKVVDAGGNPLSGKPVTLGLSTTLGGLSLASASGVTDTSGQVVATVNSGTFSTPVRVTASTPGAVAGTTLSTQSSQLSITTGIPDQVDFSVSATQHNIEGLSYDGTTTILTARLADHFKNPAPDGTTVNFTSESGSIVATCNTVAGACSATLTTQGVRPSNGRATVLAYAVGEESFIDLNGNGLADLATTFTSTTNTTGNEMLDINGVSTDLPEAYVDYNENGVHDTNEPYVDFNQNHLYDGPDGKYSGVLCDNTVAPPTGSSAGTCAVAKTLTVSASQVIVFSGSKPVITLPATTIALPPCTPAGVGAPTSFTFSVVDANGNAMPVGTTISVATTNGIITSGSSFIVADTSGCRTGYAGCPATATSVTFQDYLVTMKSDATLAAGVCTNTNGISGTLNVTVTTPKGLVSTSGNAVVTD